MDMSIEKLRNALSKDDHEYINSKLETLKAEAIASLEPTIGIDSEGAKNVAKNSTLDILSDRYIVEYCRKALDDVDNDKVLLALQIQMQVVNK